MIVVKEICNSNDLEKAFAIRKKVFVEEQNVPINEEYDEFENSSKHFLAYINDTPVGTCRWRITEKGIKLERFAVLKDFRSNKVGSALVESALIDVKKNNNESKKIYLHAQLSAMSLYAKFGFKPLGEMFSECDIQHFKMELSPEG